MFTDPPPLNGYNLFATAVRDIGILTITSVLFAFWFRKGISKNAFSYLFVYAWLSNHAYELRHKKPSAKREKSPPPQSPSTKPSNRRKPPQRIVLGDLNLYTPEELVNKLFKLAQDFDHRDTPKAIVAIYEFMIEHHMISNLPTLIKGPGRDVSVFHFLVIKGYLNVHYPAGAMTLLNEMVNLGFRRSLDFYENVMKELACFHYHREALEVYQMMRIDGHAPHSVTLSCMVHSADQCKKYEAAKSFFNDLAAQSVPSIRACMMVLSVYAKLGDTESVWSLLEMMESRSVAIDTVVLNNALSVMVNAGKMDYAKAVVTRFGSDVMDTITYNTLMKGYARAGDLSEVISVFSMMNNTEIQPNHISCNTMLDAFVRARDMQNALKTISGMEGMNLKPDKYTASTLIKGLAYCKEPDFRDYLNKCIELVVILPHPRDLTETEFQIGLYVIVVDHAVKHSRLDLLVQLFKHMISWKTVQQRDIDDSLKKN